MISPPGYQQRQSPDRRNTLLLAFLRARRSPSKDIYGHHLYGEGGGSFASNAASFPSGVSGGGSVGGGGGFGATYGNGTYGTGAYG